MTQSSQLLLMRRSLALALDFCFHGIFASRGSWSQAAPGPGGYQPNKVGFNQCKANAATAGCQLVFLCALERAGCVGSGCVREKCQLEAESRERPGNSSCWGEWELGRAGHRGITETSVNTGGLCTYPIPGYHPLPGIQVAWEELVSQYSPP